MNLFSNPWVIGVGGGVISGLLVTLITRYLFSRREQREYRQKVETANNEIIYAIRPAIAEKVIPSSAMLEALFSATARKYGVNSADLLSRVGLANELMKEVMDNTFLSSQQKVEFCELLIGVKQPEAEATPKLLVEVVTVTKRGDAFDSSAVLGMTTAVMALVVTMYIYLKKREDFLGGELLVRVFPLLIGAAVIPIAVFMFLDLARRRTRLRPEIDEEKGRAPTSVASGDSKDSSDKTSNKPMQPTQ